MPSAPRSRGVSRRPNRPPRSPAGRARFDRPASASTVATAERRIWLLETLHDVLSFIAAQDEVEANLSAVAFEIYRHFRFTSVAVGVIEGDQIVYHGLAMEWQPNQLSNPITGGICGRVVRTGVAELVPDVAVDPDYIPTGGPVQAEAAVPLVVDRRIWGVLNVEAAGGVPLGPEELDVLQTVGASIALAVERCRRRQSEQRRLRQLAGLQKLAGEIAGRVRMSSDFADLLAEIDQLFDFHGTTLGFIRGDEVHFYTSHSGDVPGDEPHSIGSPNRGITGRVIRTGEPAFVPNVDEDPDFVRYRDDLTQEICAPIRVGGEIVAVFDVELDDRRSIDEGDFDVVRTLAGHIGLALENQRRIEELERRNRHLRTVERVTAVIASKLDVRDAADEILAEIEDAFGFGTSSISVIEGDRLRFLAIRQLVPGDFSHFLRDGVPLGVGITGRVAATGEPIFVHDVRDEPSYLRTSDTVMSEICVPIKAEGRTIGFLNVETPAARPLTHEDFETISILANHLGVGMAKSDLYLAELRTRRAMEALQRVTTIVAGTLDPDEALRLIVDTLAETFGYPVVAFRLLQGNRLVASTAFGVDNTLRPPEVRVGEGIVGRVAATGLAEFVPDVSAEPGFIRIRPDITSEICVPVRSSDQLLGVLNVEGNAERPLTEQDLYLLQTFADHAGILLNNARMYERMETLASRDPMTNLPNHREFQVRLHEELGRAERHQRPLSLLVIDLDRFKEINDQYGHLAGDEALRAIAKRLAQGLRESDVLARYAGDEFVAILPETTVEAARMIAERLIQLTNSTPFLIRHEIPVTMSLSIGIATFPDDATSQLELIRLADDAMYRAKRSGLGIGTVDDPPGEA